MRTQPIYQNLSQSLHFTYFIHAGLLDAITTFFGMQLGFFELNPLVAMLYPEQMFFMPAVLIGLSFMRTYTILWLFKNHRHFRSMLWFTMYFPPTFNVANIILHYLNMQDVAMLRLVLF
ncbi:DUF5658 family protein [Candidatus Nitrosotenuis uzonensis]